MRNFHGRTGTPIYLVWIHMRQRCKNPNNPMYKHYGGRGISICEEWLNNSLAFINWAINNGFQENLEIDRIDNNGNYSPDNCRFVTRKANTRNTRRNIFFSYKGETKILIEWVEMLGLNYETIYPRLYRGWDFKKAVETPIKTVA